MRNRRCCSLNRPNGRDNLASTRALCKLVKNATSPAWRMTVHVQPLS